MRLRNDYAVDTGKGVERWNKIIARTGVDFQIRLPHAAFHRHIGEFSAAHATPDGEIIAEAEWQARRDDWLPSSADADYIDSLMTPVSEPGRFANWIAPPKAGIDNRPGDFEYVKIDD